MIKTETLRIKSEYQESLREARIKGTSEHGTEEWLKLKVLEQESKMLQQMV